MKVSVLIPFHAAEVQEITWLEEAINSALSQTYQGIEVVVVNDDSPRRWTWAKRRIKSKSVVWAELPKEKHGVSAARNHAAFIATGELLLPLDHDDLLEKEAATWMVESYQEHGGNETGGPVIYGDLKIFGKDSERIWRCKEGCNELLKDVMAWNSSLFAKSAWAAVGGWNENLLFLEDWDFNIRMIEKEICLHHLGRVVAWYRQRPDSRMAKLKAQPDQYAQAYATLRGYHADFFNGRLKSMCCGSQIPAPPSGGDQLKRAPVAPVGDRVLVKYVGSRQGSFLASAPSGVKYRIPGSGEYIETTDGQPGVDPKDVSWFTKLNNGKDFIQV